MFSFKHFQILRYLDLILVICFTIEIAMKTIAFGFVIHEGSFCRNGWHLLDLVVVVVSWMSIAISLVIVAHCVG